MLLPQPSPQLRPQPASIDNGKRLKLDKKFTEEELKKRSLEGEVEDEVSSLEEFKVQKKLVKEVEIEVMENSRFMSEARRKLSFSPHPRHRRGELGAHAASAIQQPVVKHEQERKPEVMGASGVLPPPSSFQSYQSTSETKRFSFQRLVPRWPERFFWPPPTVYIAILTHAAV
jgi:hypothetical protein